MVLCNVLVSHSRSHFTPSIPRIDSRSTATLITIKHLTKITLEITECWNVGIFCCWLQHCLWASTIITTVLSQNLCMKYLNDFPIWPFNLHSSSCNTENELMWLSVLAYSNCIAQCHFNKPKWGWTLLTKWNILQRWAAEGGERGQPADRDWRCLINLQTSWEWSKKR